MIRKYLPFLAAILSAFFVSAVCAQSVVITSKKITYRRPKPLMEHKKSFTVVRPQVRGLAPALNKKVEAAISYERVLKLNIREEIREIQWLYEADYEVVYNKNGILAVRLWLDGSGAYPSVFDKTVVVDLKTGARVAPGAVFTNLNALAAKIKKAQQAEIKKAREDYKKDPENSDFDGTEYFQKADFKAANLNEFSVGDRGVTFVYDYNFPHVVQALQPDGRFFFSWADLKPYIRRDGLFGKLAR